MSFATLGKADFGAYEAAEPGDARSFLERWNSPDTPEQLAARGDLIAKAAEETRLARLTSSRNEALADAADRRIETAKTALGVDIRNPYRQGYYLEAQRRYDDMRARGEEPGPRVDAVGRLQRDLFNEAIDAAAEAHPDKAAALNFGQPLEDAARAISTNAEDAANQARRRAMGAGVGTVDRFGAELFGGLWGARRDPISLTSLVFGPTQAVGKQALTRVLTASAAQGAFNVGIEFLQHPTVELWRRERGREQGGMLPSAQEAGFAFLLGAIPGAGIQAGIELGARGTRVLAAGQRSMEADRLLLTDERPPWVTPELHEETAAAALRHAGDPANEAPAPVSAFATSNEGAKIIDAVRAAPDPITAAETLRADPAATAAAAASPAPDVQGAGRLASLSDEAFGLVRNGEADPMHGVVVAELGPPPEMQAAVLARVTEAKPETLQDARLVAADAIEDEASRIERGRVEAETTTVEVRPSAMRGPAARPEETWSLLEFLAHRGGIRADDPLISDLRASIGRDHKLIPGFGALIRKNGMPLDRAREAAVEAGYIWDIGMVEGRETTTNINTLLERMDAELRGEKQYRQGVDAPENRGRKRDELERLLDEELEADGVGAAAVTGNRRKRVLQIMEREGVSDPLEAYERALLEEVQRNVEAGPVRRIEDDIPGWDVPDDTRSASPTGGAFPGEPRPQGAGDGEQPRSPGERDRTPSGEGGGGGGGDPLNLVPMTREDGSISMVRPDELARMGEREGLWADLVRSCNPVRGPI